MLGQNIRGLNIRGHVALWEGMAGKGGKEGVGGEIMIKCATRQFRIE